MTELVLLDGPAITKSMGLSESRLRKWAQRGVVTTYGTDGRGRTMYDVHEVLARVSGNQNCSSPTTVTADSSTTVASTGLEST